MNIKLNTKIGIVTVGVLANAAVLWAAYDLTWHTVDGGGTGNSTGGSFSLAGTIGQSDAGSMSGGSYVLTGGFWAVPATAAPPPTCEGDANADGQVDPLDSGFVLARLGCDPGAGDTDCISADVNSDGVVDPLDAGFVLARFGDCP